MRFNARLRSGESSRDPCRFFTRTFRRFLLVFAAIWRFDTVKIPTNAALRWRALNGDAPTGFEWRVDSMRRLSVGVASRRFPPVLRHGAPRR